MTDIEATDSIGHAVEMGPDGALQFGGITREQALSATGGGDQAMEGDTREMYADRIQSSAAGNAAWLSSRPVAEQMMRASVPVVHVPPNGGKPDTKPDGKSGDARDGRK